ncbi:MAG: MarR family EPS-associated transcriptional regulator [Steroidobacteraceae bacterium]
MFDEETHFKVLRLLEANPAMSQRDVAQALDVSLGKINFCVKALVRKGLLKVSNFKNSHNKAAYMYLLTPRGIELKGRLALRFLHSKTLEYEALQAEILLLRREAGEQE